MKKTIILVPPDGGYGWVIVFACALNNFFVIPLLQNFGLIFKDTFAQLGLSATQGSFILNLNSAFGILTGLINGPLLNHFGYRKISVVGAALICSGVFLTAFAESFLGFVITYGLISSLGLGLTMSSYGLAVNTYFKEKKSRAIGITMAITGLGPIIMPQVINLLLQNYTLQGVTIILSGICCNSFVAASLLQPIKYHMKKKVIEDENELSKIEEEHEGEDDSIADEMPKFSLIRSYTQAERNSYRFRRKESLVSIYYEQESAGIYGFDSTLGGSFISLDSVALMRRNSTIRTNTKTQWWKSASSVNLQSSYNLFEERKKKNSLDNTLSLVPRLSQTENVYNELSVQKKPKKPRWKRILKRVVVIFDLTLLKDPVYLNIMFGMSLAIFAEMNFSVLTPFILNDIGLSTAEIAIFLSTLGTADIIFRFLAPYIGDLLNQPPRITYLIALLALISTRFLLLIFSEYRYLLGVAAALGVVKGVRAVYMSLVIPTYVSLDRLASASGIQMMVNGFFIITGGPLLGLVRDLTGSYKYCIVIMNCVTFTTVMMWTTEFVGKRVRDKKNIPKEEISEEQES